MTIIALLAGCFTIDDAQHEKLVDHAKNKVPLAEATLEVDGAAEGTAYADSLLRCAVVLSDPDSSQDVLGADIAWAVDGVSLDETGETLEGAFAKGQRVSCTATPYDDLERGEPATAETVIENTPAPAPAGADIAPASPATTADLECSATFDATDIDGDSLAAAYFWTLNGELQEGSSAEVDSASTRKGQAWGCTACLYEESGAAPETPDGGSCLAASTVSVVNTPPDIGTPVIAP